MDMHKHILSHVETFVHVSSVLDIYEMTQVFDFPPSCAVRESKQKVRDDDGAESGGRNAT